MPETGKHQTFDQAGNIIEEQEFIISDDELLLRELDHKCNDFHIEGLTKYRNWATLTPPERVAVIKELLGCVLSLLRKVG